MGGRQWRGGHWRPKIWRGTATVFRHSLQRCVGAKLLRCCETKPRLVDMVSRCTNTMLARLSNDDLREENAQLKSEIVALRMEISKRRAGVAQSDVSCTSHQVRMLIA